MDKTPPELNRVSRFLFGLFALLSVGGLGYTLAVPGLADHLLQLLQPLLAASTVLFLLLWWLGIRRTLNQQQHYAQECHRQQVQWQSALQQLAKGDLTSTEETPEAVRTAVAPVQELVKQVRALHLQLLNCSHETQASTLRLQETTEHQQDQMTQALTQHQDLTRQWDRIVTQAQDAQAKSVALQQSLTRLADTDELHGLTDRQPQQTAAEHLQQAATQTRAMQQQIGLIADLADQSNILALNTAMQAALAGEAGRAFRVVGDEVQRLAQLASDSTRQISARLQTMQTHQQAGLEQLQHQVAQSDRMAQACDLRQQQLAQLSADSRALAEPLAQGKTAAEQQTEALRRLGDHLHIIQTIGQQTTEGVTQTTEATAALHAKIAPLATALMPYQPESSTTQTVLSATA